MDKLINVTIYMVIFSTIALSSTIAEAIIWLILAAVVYILGHWCRQLVIKVTAVYEYMLTHKESHTRLEGEIKRVDSDIKNIKEDFGNFRAQIEKLTSNIDSILKEVRKT